MLKDVLVGSRITADEKIQANLIANDVGARFEQRWFALVPTEKWGNSYLSPVGTTVADDPAAVVLFNPDKDSDLTVDVTTTTGTTPVTVPAGSLFKYTMPSEFGRAVRFQ